MRIKLGHTCVQDLLVLIVLNRGAQIVGARLLWQLNFVQRHLFVDCQCGPIFMSLFCHLEFRGVSFWRICVVPVLNLYVLVPQRYLIIILLFV